jgi:energy-converting hydrogenase B subunit D
MTSPVAGVLAAHGPLAVVTPYSVQPALMDTLQVVLLILVAAGATAVALTRVPVRQAVALSAYGLLLAVLFLAFQAPDVTLSELVVGAVALPILLLLALTRVRRREK